MWTRIIKRFENLALWAVTVEAFRFALSALVFNFGSGRLICLLAFGGIFSIFALYAGFSWYLILLLDLFIFGAMLFIAVRSEMEIRDLRMANPGSGRRHRKRQSSPVGAKNPDSDVPDLSSIGSANLGTRSAVSKGNEPKCG